MTNILENLKNKETISILFICSGNIIRSVMAEFLFKKMIREQTRNYDKFVVNSGAVLFKNSNLHEFTKEILIKEGFKKSLIDTFKPTYLKNKENFHLLVESDIIIVMEKSHLHLIPKNLRDKSFLLAELVNENIILPDPFGTDINVYYEIYDKIKFLIQKFINIMVYYGILLKK
ncbi:MAG: arsenate reductase/protein-tyrosine-phosphatase family protein [Candidatus Helarchaeota archaeon]